MIDKDDIKPERLARTTIYESPWVNLYVDKVRFPDGRIIEKHHFLDFEKESVVVLAENNADQILLVQAFRYTTGVTGWELPAGWIEKGESPIEAAHREVLEESGFETISHNLIYTFNNLSGISNQVAHVVNCKTTTGSGNFDKNEVKAVKWFSRAAARQLVEAKTIKDGISLVGLLLYFNQMI